MHGQDPRGRRIPVFLGKGYTCGQLKKFILTCTTIQAREREGGKNDTKGPMVSH
jgi:hypothetical protein